jgi:HAD superfamily hydrolase (TIGR01509 family)
VTIPGSRESRARRRSPTQTDPATTRALHVPIGIRAVVFDLDGLLFNTENLWAEEEFQMLADHGVEYVVDDRLATVGQTIDTSVAYYARRIGLPTSALPALRNELTQRVRAAMVQRLQPLPGAIELVRVIERSGLPLGIASNNDKDLALLALDVAGLADAFDVVVSAEEVERAKPAPDVYLRACAALRVAPSEALALEDSSSGIAAAHAAGMLVYAVPQFAGMDVSTADRVLTSLEELLR